MPWNVTRLNFFLQLDIIHTLAMKANELKDQRRPMISGCRVTIEQLYTLNTIAPVSEGTMPYIGTQITLHKTKWLGLPLQVRSSPILAVPLVPDSAGTLLQYAASASSSLAGRLQAAAATEAAIRESTKAQLDSMGEAPAMQCHLNTKL